MNNAPFKINLLLSVHISLASPNNYIKIIVNNSGGHSPHWLVLITRGSDILLSVNVRLKYEQNATAPGLFVDTYLLYRGFIINSR